MTDRSEWEGRVGHAWAEQWRRTDRSFAGLTDRLLGAASARPITQALDVGCGAGELSLALARGHGGARIVGIDVSAQLIEAARSRAERLPNLSFVVGDAADWFDETLRPDLIVSRHGVMFFTHPIGAFTHLAGLAGSDGRLVFSCFRDRDENPWASAVAALLPGGSPPPAAADEPGPFAFADRGRVERILREAGWREVAFEPVDYAFIAGAGPDPLADAIDYFLAIGPAARGAAQLDAAGRAQFVDRLRRYLERHADESLVALPAAAWIVTARTR